MIKQLVKHAEGSGLVKGSKSGKAIFEWWLGIGLLMFVNGEWVLSPCFYGGGGVPLFPSTRSRFELVQELRGVPSFLAWLRLQFNWPRTTGDLRNKMLSSLPGKRYCAGLQLWRLERAQRAEPYLNRDVNLAWRLLSII